MRVNTTACRVQAGLAQVSLPFLELLRSRFLCFFFPLISLLLLPPCPESKAYVNPLVCAFFISLLPIWIVIAKRNSATREVLYSGWEPVIIAMAISRWAWPCPQTQPGSVSLLQH